MMELSNSSPAMSKKLVELRDNFSRNSQSWTTSINGKTTDMISEHFQIKKSAAIQSTVANKVAATKPEYAGCSSFSGDQDQVELQRLREFDLNAEFGPCTGVSRMERWRRAEAYGFKPPVDVRILIADHPADTRYTESVWFGEKL